MKKTLLHVDDELRVMEEDGTGRGPWIKVGYLNHATVYTTLVSNPTHNERVKFWMEDTASIEGVHTYGTTGELDPRRGRRLFVHVGPYVRVCWRHWVAKIPKLGIFVPRTKVLVVISAEKLETVDDPMEPWVGAV